LMAAGDHKLSQEKSATSRLRNNYRSLNSNPINSGSCHSCLSQPEIAGSPYDDSHPTKLRVMRD
jgi:hypothetical protein